MGKSGKHSICRVYSDVEIMRHRLRGLITSTRHVRTSQLGGNKLVRVETLPCCRVIDTWKLKQVLLRQKVPKRLWRGRIYKYRSDLEGCSLCKNYIGLYPVK